MAEHPLAGARPNRVAVVVGTRPEAIKQVPVIRALARHADAVEPVVISTGQHREMLDQILVPFGVRVDHDLALMEPGQSLPRLSSRALDAFDAVLERVRPSLVLVQGDTTTAFIGALAAFYRKIPVGHVEAGLRTGHRWSPFPEEINRRLISPIAELNFAPTEDNRRNLLAEGIPRDRVFVTGNTVIDALLLARELDLPGAPVPGLDRPGRLVLVTAHRRESFGAPLEELFRALAELAAAYPDVTVLYPVHLNPNVQAPAKAILSSVPNVVLTPPLDYFSFVRAMARACFIVTDSGGVQEEAPSLGVPVLVARAETERGEAVRAGTVRLVGTRREDLLREARLLLDDPDERARRSRAINPYGDGRAGARIAARALAWLGTPRDPPTEFVAG